MNDWFTLSEEEMEKLELKTLQLHEGEEVIRAFTGHYIDSPVRVFCIQGGGEYKIWMRYHVDGQFKVLIKDQLSQEEYDVNVKHLLSEMTTNGAIVEDNTERVVELIEELNREQTQYRRIRR